MPIHPAIEHANQLGQETAVLHEVGEMPKYFPRLNKALKHASEFVITGYIVTPVDETGGRSIIEIRKGKRKSERGTWIDAYYGRRV